MRTGILGGTFDPVHNGHLRIARAAYEQFALDRVLFMPSGNPPHKQRRWSSDRDRAAMIRLAIKDTPFFAFSDFEMHPEKGAYTYTYQTLEKMKAADPGDDIFFIIGEDSLKDFPIWRHPERIAALCTLLVAPRETAAGEALSEKIRLVRETFSADIERIDVEMLPISSHEVREAAVEGASLESLLPEAVAAYIRSNHLYVNHEIS